MPELETSNLFLAYLFVLQNWYQNKHDKDPSNFSYINSLTKIFN